RDPLGRQLAHEPRELLAVPADEAEARAARGVEARHLARDRGRGAEDQHALAHVRRRSCTAAGGSATARRAPAMRLDWAMLRFSAHRPIKARGPRRRCYGQALMN